MISWEQIENLARKNNIDRISILREYLQVVFLGNLYQEKASQHLYFKGGTAIRLFLDGRRFSRDLDFTATLPEKEILTLVEKTVIKVNQTVEPDLKLINQEKKKQSFRRRLVYNSPSLTQKLTIPVEISLREKPLTEKVTVLRTEFPMPMQPVVRHLDWPEILAEKIRAIMTRNMGRDIYDLWFLLAKDIPVDWRMVNQKMEYYGKKITIVDLKETIEKFLQKKLEQDLKEYLPSSEREKLPAELKKLIQEEFQRRGLI